MNFKDIDQLLISKLPVNENDKHIFQRRVNKFKKDPKGFLEGSYKKRSTQVRAKLPIKYSGVNNFTVISAVYNVEKYLDDYFKSLVNQSLNFKKHIQLILVDDGSTDESAAIIKKWQNKYPRNITYIHKENGGQASARNIGLEYLSTEWVTFIDPDDFIDINYFKGIDRFIINNSKVKVVASPLLFYIEDTGQIKDNHPLNYRFKKGSKVVLINKLDTELQLSASTAIFNSKGIRNIRFNEDIKPSFEDAKFVLDYLIDNYESSIGFIDDVSYFYRKRSDGSSSLDTAWQNTGLFTTVLEEGVLNALELAERKFGFVPVFVQRTALYHLYWYFGRIINNSSSLNHLSVSEKERFSLLVHKIFNKIEPQVIEKFNLGGAWFFHKVGFLGLFKNQQPSSQIVYIDDFDVVKNQVLCSFFSQSNVSEEYLLDGVDTIPAFRKLTSYSFIEQKFVDEYRVWLNCGSNKALSIKINGKHAKISYKGKHYNSLYIDDIENDYFTSSTKDNSLWIFIDRNNQADDNAEHLYRYILNNNLRNNIYFALNRDSHDWKRLEDEGFLLLEFGSKKFEKALKGCDKIISSHVDGYITNYFGDNSLLDKDFIFLQHGVTKDDLSTWLNTKKNISKFITTTKGEYESICEDGSPYKFTKKETVLTGFPRYDRLLKGNLLDTKNILVMPTWRNEIVGKIVTGTVREYNSNFMNTEYAVHWHSFLNGSFIEDLVKKYGYSITFVPHPNVQEYMDVFTLPNYINVWKYKDGDIQKIFQEAKILITDYSSVAFDVAYLNKLVFYYHFDADKIFNGSHTYKRGYYSYERDGFGPVSKTEKDLNNNLNNFLIENDTSFFKKFNKRIEGSFIFRDSDNCKRVYESIISLDQPGDQSIDVNILYQLTINAYNNKSWELVESRSELLSNIGNEKQKQWSIEVLLEALFKQNKFNMMSSLIDIHYSETDYSKCWKAKIAFAVGDWNNVISYLDKVPSLDNEVFDMLLDSYCELNMVQEFEAINNEAINRDLPYDDSKLTMLKAKELQVNSEWGLLEQLLKKELSNFTENELIEFRPHLLIAQACRKLGNYEEAHKYVAGFEKIDSTSSRCRLEIARLAFLRKEFDKCINKYNQLVNNNISMLAEPYAIEYIACLLHTDRIKPLLDLTPILIDLHPECIDMKLILISGLERNKSWSEVVKVAENYKLQSYPGVIQSLTLAKYRLGYLKEAYEGLKKPTNQDSYEYWILVAEIALLMEDTDFAKYCYKMMVALFPNYNKDKSLDMLNQLSQKYLCN